MCVVSFSALKAFWRVQPDAEPNLRSWATVVERANWKNPVEMKRAFGYADLVGRRTVFNVAGNKYRLIARINYISQKVFVLYLLTHAEYERGAWRK
jgi:mRNA interferase HigB